jgi:hypothetical protein
MVHKRDSGKAFVPGSREEEVAVHMVLAGIFDDEINGIEKLKPTLRNIAGR